MKSGGMKSNGCENAHNGAKSNANFLIAPILGALIADYLPVPVRWC
jgi:hypothetical protein